MTDRDFLGNQINIGDEVIFEAPHYRDFVVGKVITKAPKSCQIKFVNTWNYGGKGEIQIVRQGYGQVIKLSAIKEREERSKPLAWLKYSYDEWICPNCGYDKYCDTLNGGVLPPFCERCGRPLKGAEHE